MQPPASCMYVLQLAVSLGLLGISLQFAGPVLLCPAEQGSKQLKTASVASNSSAHGVATLLHRKSMRVDTVGRGVGHIMLSCRSCCLVGHAVL